VEAPHAAGTLESSGAVLPGNCGWTESGAVHFGLRAGAVQTGVEDLPELDQVLEHRDRRATVMVT
jgi:glycine/D-amino acid oxidase-like deaminating enzyme